MRISDWSSDVCSSDLLLAAFAAETRRDFVVLTLNIEHDNRIRPLQQIGNDDADALARSGRGFEQYMLHLAHHEKAVAEKAIADAAEHNALFRAKARLADFTFARETRLAVKVLFRPQDDRHEQHRQRHADDRASPKRFGHDRIMPIIPEEAGKGERIVGRGGHLEEEPSHRAGQQADQQERDRKEEKRTEENTSELQSLMR